MMYPDILADIRNLLGGYLDVHMNQSILPTPITRYTTRLTKFSVPFSDDFITSPSGLHFRYCRCRYGRAGICGALVRICAHPGALFPGTLRWTLRLKGLDVLDVWHCSRRLTLRRTMIRVKEIGCR